MRRLSIGLEPRSRRTRLGFRAGLFVSLSALTLAACAGKSEPARGQITLALSSDMSLPKDVDSIRIQVLVQGRPHFDASYDVGAGRTDAKMPATLAIVAGDDPSIPVEIRVLAFRNNASEVRTLNKTITTIPEGRNAMLRVPIQWLCTGQVTRVDSDTFQTRCESDDEGNETSCVAGLCEKVEVEEESLPDFTAARVFGGADGTQGDGQCFPTEECFDNAEKAFDVTPNLTDCTVDIQVPDDEQPNFAILVPDDGICSGVRCYVPLDENDEDATDTTGWSAIDGASGNLQRFALPPGVCARIQSGAALGVRATTGCVTKTPATPPCGPWSSVGDPETNPIPPPPTETCQNFIPGQNVGSPTPSPIVNEYLQATADIRAYAEQAKAQLANACAEVAVALGTPVTLPNPPTDNSLAEACASAAQALTGAPERAEFSLLGGYCRANVAAQEACEAACSPAATATAEERCTSPSGVCTGTCEGTCFTTPDSPVECAGTCEGVCDGDCVGTCLGTFAAASTSNCGGTCVGTCNGSCAGACDTLTDGTCSGRCEIPDGSGVACEGGFDQASDCALPLAADDTIDPVCAAVCMASAASTPPDGEDTMMMQVVDCSFEVPALSSAASAASRSLAPAIRLGQEAIGKSALLVPVVAALDAATVTLEESNGDEPYAATCLDASGRMLIEAAQSLAVIEASGGELRTALGSAGGGSGGSGGMGGAGGASAGTGGASGGAGGTGNCAEERVPTALNASCDTGFPVGADPTLVNIYYTATPDDAPLRVPMVPSMTQCTDQPAWYYDAPADPTTITLCALLCETYNGSTEATVELAVGCPTLTTAGAGGAPAQ